MTWECAAILFNIRKGQAGRDQGTPGAGGSKAGVVGAAGGRLDVALQEVEEGDRVGQPVGEAAVVVLLLLYLPAHGVDDLRSA